MVSERRPRFRGPTRALFFAAVAAVLHVVVMLVEPWIARLLPERKIEREVEVTWLEQAPSDTPNDVTLPPSLPTEATAPPLPPLTTDEIAQAPNPPKPKEKKEPPKLKVPELALLP